MSGFIEVRKRQFVEHFLRIDKILKKLIPVVGQASAILGAVSVGTGKDVDIVGEIIDDILDPILGKIPVVGKFLVSKDEESGDSYIDSDGNVVMTDGGRDTGVRRRNNSSEEGVSGGKVIALLAGVFVIGGILMFTVVGDYTSYAGGGVMDSLAVSPAMGTLTEEVRYQGSRAAGFARCVGEGPHCLEEYQLNQTSRPGSESVGQQYGLEVRNFELGAGESIDVAFEGPDQAIPVVFDIHNPRHGIRGIEAMNVSYQVEIRDGSTTYCNTGWVPIDGYNISGEADGHYENNDLIPGTSASSGFTELTTDHSAIEEGQELTLGNCRMMQPGSSETRNAVLQVKYDYFSQTTLNFEAMSEQVRVSEQIQTQNLDSVTADTPVQAVLGVSSPATFDEDEGEPMQPVSIGATVETEERDVSYQVEDMLIRPPGRICIASSEEDEICVDEDSFNADETQSCSFKPSEEHENGLVLQDEDKSRLMAGNDDDDGLPSDYWFDRQTQPNIFGCVFNLDTENQQITPSGETLTMHMESNYTARLDENLGNFEVFNDLCREHNCPFVLPLNEENFEDALSATSESDPNYAVMDRATCDGTAAADGCGVTITDDISIPEIEKELDRDQTALQVTEEFLTDPARSHIFTEETTENAAEVVEELEEGVISFELEDMYEASALNSKALHIDDDGQTTLQEVEDEEDEDDPESSLFSDFVSALT